MPRLALGWGASVRNSVSLPAATPNSGRPNVELPAIPRLVGRNSVSSPAIPPNSAHLRPIRGPDAAFMRPNQPDPLLGVVSAPRMAPDGRASPRASAARAPTAGTGAGNPRPAAFPPPPP